MRMQTNTIFLCILNQDDRDDDSRADIDGLVDDHPGSSLPAAREGRAGKAAVRTGGEAGRFNKQAK